MASEFEFLEIKGARQAARARTLARALHDLNEPSGPAHPDFGPSDCVAADAVVDLASRVEDRDIHVDFALMRHVVDRMRAAFFHERS